MVLEVVSHFSEDKDTTFVDLNFKAGVLEYWLVDVREKPIRFDIFKRSPRKFLSARRQAGGWVRSQLFNHSFRLAQAVDTHGKPQFTLEVKE